MASSKKKQDEKHLKMLREMVALPHNKQCFDCHQRGPTYINMTIGSYVCTACSGLLRGLNPPHRVKSISMASFTPEEMDFIKCHGNEFCRKVWLGLYDNRLGNQSESRDEAKVKDFMAQKYERKRYYVAPTETMKDEAKSMNESAITKAPGTRPLKSLLGENAPRLQLASQGSLTSSSSGAGLATQGSSASLPTGEDLFGNQPAVPATQGSSASLPTGEDLFGNQLPVPASQASSASLPTGEDLFGDQPVVTAAPTAAPTFSIEEDMFGSTENANQQAGGGAITFTAPPSQLPANQMAAGDLFASPTANQQLGNNAAGSQQAVTANQSAVDDLFGSQSTNEKMGNMTIGSPVANQPAVDSLFGEPASAADTMVFFPC